MTIRFLKMTVILFGMVLADLPMAYATPLMPPMSAGERDVLPVAKQKKKTANRGGVLLGRVEDIDRREGRKAHAKRGGKLVGRAPTKHRTPRNDALDQFMGGLVGSMLGVGGASSTGCAVDYTTPNPTSCRTYRGRTGGNNGLRPPYQCVVNGRTITTNRFRAGCWMVRQNNLAIPMR